MSYVGGWGRAFFFAWTEMKLNIDTTDALTFGGLLLASIGVGFLLTPWHSLIILGAALALIGLFLR